MDFKTGFGLSLLITSLTGCVTVDLPVPSPKEHVVKNCVVINSVGDPVFNFKMNDVKSNGSNCRLNLYGMQKVEFLDKTGFNLRFVYIAPSQLTNNLPAIVRVPN